MKLSSFANRNFLYFPINHSAGNRAETSFLPISYRNVGFCTKFTNSFKNFIFFSRFTMKWRIVFPQPSLGATFGTKFLSTAIISANRIKSFFTPSAFSFFQGKMSAFSMPVMLNPMIVETHYFKIFQSIINSISIFMMNCLSFLEFSFQMFCHHISVFKHKLLTIGKGEPINIQLNIPILTEIFPACPVWMIFFRAWHSIYHYRLMPIGVKP